MARIIYKEGQEGQNRLECVEGFEIELLNKQKALIYPKYSEEIMLPLDKIVSWDAEDTTEIDALKKESNVWATGALLKCGSPAAAYVSKFRSDKYGIFGLPTLLTAMEIQKQQNDIDELSEIIEGADFLRNYTTCVWSYSRKDAFIGWTANGDYGFSNGSCLYNPYLSVPVVLYR